MTPYWQSEDSALRLHHGRWQDALASVPDGSVRLILTSPPYDNARTYEDTCEPVNFDELAAFGIRALCPGGVFAMVLDGAVNDGRQSTTPYEVMCSWASGVPHRIVRRMVAGEPLSADDVAILTAPREPPGWRLLQALAYGRRGVPGEYKGRFRRDHEPLIVMVKDGAPLICAKERIAERAMYTPSNSATFTERTGSKRGPSTPNSETREKSNRGSIWWYGASGHGHDPSADTGHPATFAERFAIDAVTVWSNPGDLVCDPFSGSGTVMQACRKLQRAFVGAERVRKYCDIAVGRLGAITPERAAEPVGPLFGGAQ